MHLPELQARGGGQMPQLTTLPQMSVIGPQPPGGGQGHVAMQVVVLPPVEEVPPVPEAPPVDPPPVGAGAVGVEHRAPASAGQEEEGEERARHEGHDTRLIVGCAHG